MTHVNDNRDMHERLFSSIREVKLNGKIVLEIRMHPKYYYLFTTSCPTGSLNLSNSGTVTFMSIPVHKEMIDEEIEWELQTE
jgi:hypothetical protein